MNVKFDLCKNSSLIFDTLHDMPPIIFSLLFSELIEHLDFEEKILVEGVKWSRRDSWDINVTSFSSIPYLSNSEYWPEKELGVGTSIT